MREKFDLPPVETTRPAMLEKAQDSAEVQMIEAAMVNVVKCAPYRYKRRTHVAVQAIGAIVGNYTDKASKGYCGRKR